MQKVHIIICLSSQVLLLEQKRDDGTWPRETTTYQGTNVRYKY